MYKYETHLHTMETSQCGRRTAEEQVRTYKAFGYDGICVTDHVLQKYIDGYECKDDWHACVDKFLLGYRTAKKYGDEIGLTVILGLEVRFPGSERDYLCYGFDEEWFYANPYFTLMDIEGFYAKFKDQILIIQAHPYRDNNTVNWKCLHGIEIVNSSPRHDSRDMLACQLAKEHPNLICTAGSDAHRLGDEAKTGILLQNQVSNSFEFAEMLRERKFEIWSPGSVAYLNMRLGYL